MYVVWPALSTPRRAGAETARPAPGAVNPIIAGKTAKQVKVWRFKPGTDLAALIWAALSAQGIGLLDGDVVVIAQKAVSKAEAGLSILLTLPPHLLRGWLQMPVTRTRTMVRGDDYPRGNGSATELVRSAERDLFR